jgi:cell division protein FtsL
VLENLARKDQKLKSVFLTIKQDIQTLEEELAEHQKRVKANERKFVKDLRKYLRFYKLFIMCS